MSSGLLLPLTAHLCSSALEPAYGTYITFQRPPGDGEVGGGLWHVSNTSAVPGPWLSGK